MTENAELALCAAAFTDPRVHDDIALTGAAFADARLGAMWDTLAALHEQGTRPDPVTITEAARSNPFAGSLVPLAVELITYPTVVGNAASYAAVVHDGSERRRLLDAAAGFAQRVNDPTVELDAALSYAERAILGTASGQDREAESLLTYEEFVSQPLPPMQWVIPGLLAEEERVVLTGGEGAGKTTTMRQFGVMVASGLHPFTLADIPPRNVLYVDCENPKRLMIQRFSDLGAVAARRNRKPDKLTIRRYPQGIDLGKPDDRMKLRYLCRTANPDLLLIGPAYKLYQGGSNSREEDLARTVAQALDDLREEFGFALILEHHMPKDRGENRSAAPIGSSLWMRWPEFGLGIVLDEQASTFTDRHAKVTHWRGARDERPWPRELRSGLPGELPWVDPQRFGS